MRVIVTGSAGFIGGHLTSALLSRRHRVLGIDLDSALTRDEHYDHAVCDVRDAAALSSLFSSFEPDAVLHLAARTDLHGRDVTAYSSNTDGTRALLSAVRATPSVRRVICTSSQLVNRLGHAPSHDREYDPDTAYGSSKAEMEQICRAENGGAIEWCIVRPTTIWGPGMGSHYLPFFRLVRRGLYFHIGSEPRLKSYGYVGNTVHQYLQLLNAAADHIQGRVFYLADYAPIDLREWADAFQEEMQAPRIHQVPHALAVAAARTGDVLNRLGASLPVSSFRLRNVLTSFTFDLGATEAVCGALPYDMRAGVAETTRWLNTVL